MAVSASGRQPSPSRRPRVSSRASALRAWERAVTSHLHRSHHAVFGPAHGLVLGFLALLPRCRARGFGQLRAPFARLAVDDRHHVPGPARFARDVVHAAAREVRLSRLLVVEGFLELLARVGVLSDVRVEVRAVTLAAVQTSITEGSSYVVSSPSSFSTVNSSSRSPWPCPSSGSPPAGSASEEAPRAGHRALAFRSSLA